MSSESRAIAAFTGLGLALVAVAMAVAHTRREPAPLRAASADRGTFVELPVVRPE
jgi:hypothetical protein